MSEKELEVWHTFPFDFHGDIYTIALASDRQFYVPVSRICESLGINDQAQLRRIRRSSTLRPGLARIGLPTEYRGDVRILPMLCLNVELVPEWVTGIDETRIVEDALPDVVRLKEEFSLVVRAYFRSAIIPEDLRTEIDIDLSPELRRLYEMTEALAFYVHKQQEQLGVQSGRLDHVEKILVGLQAQFEGEDFINTHQQAKFQAMVAALGALLEEKGKGTYAIVHNELKKQFHFPKYSLIPASKFPDIVVYMTSWYRRVADPGAPLPEAFRRPDQPNLL